MAVKVYCEHGALTKRLRVLQREGKIELVHFPYDRDARTKHIAATALPSEAQWRDMNITWNEALFTWDDCRGSLHFGRTRRIIGLENRRDALHVDSAFKSGCACFITEDTDILSKRNQLEELLKIRFFHPRREELQFIEFVALLATQA